MASGTRKWLVGCGIGCGFLILAAGGIGTCSYVGIQKLKDRGERLDAGFEELHALYGRPAEFVPPADGVVSRATRKSDYGKVIDISHGYGYVTRYAHLSEVLVRPGQKVRRGEEIGRVGTTGRSTGPHLHYEVFRDGRRVNPWKYLGQKGR